jgi:hypothetical protein
MKKETRRTLRLVAFLVLLGLLTLMLVKRQGVTLPEAEADAVWTAGKLEERVFRDEYRAAGFLAVVALFAFVTWAAVRARQEEDKARPPAKEASANDTAALH